MCFGDFERITLVGIRLCQKMDCISFNERAVFCFIDKKPTVAVNASFSLRLSTRALGVGYGQ